MKKSTTRIFGLLLALMLIVGTFSVAIAEAPTTAAPETVTFAKSEYYVVTGLQTTAAFAETNVPSTVKFYIQPQYRKMATVNADTGVITGHSVGEAVLWAVETAGAQPVALTSAAIFIGINGAEFTMVTTDEYDFYVSAKNIYRNNGKTIANSFVYNRTRSMSQIYAGSGNLYMIVLDVKKWMEDDYELDNAYVGYTKLGKRINLGRNLKAGKSMSFSTTIKNIDGDIDFRETVIYDGERVPRYEPVLYTNGGLYGKSLGKGILSGSFVPGE